MCAYCGKEAPDTEDHVIPKCLYAAGYAPPEYLTVPSHLGCNKGFSDAETRFKEDISAAGANDAAAAARESVLRNFGRPEGRQGGLDLLARSSDGKIYPVQNPDTALILRKVTRGLAFYHALHPPFPEDLVEVGYAQFVIPPAFVRQALHEVRHPAVFECHALVVDDLGDDEVRPPDLHSFWRLRFYARVAFDAFIIKAS